MLTDIYALLNDVSLAQDLPTRHHGDHPSPSIPHKLSARCGSRETWVARICGTSDRHGLAREFLRPDARALTYELADGGIYQVQHGDGTREYILVAGQRAQPLDQCEVWSLIRLPIASSSAQVQKNTTQCAPKSHLSSSEPNRALSITDRTFQ